MKFEEFIEKTKYMGLTRKENAEGRRVLMAAIAERSAVNELPDHAMSRVSMPLVFINKLFAKPMPIILAIALFAAGGVSYAAENSLPGDVLWPVKVNVNEEVRLAFALSPEGKAEWEALRAERRLEEAGVLAAEGQLNAETGAVIQARLNEHLNSSLHYVEGKEERAEAIVRFEAAIKAHQQIWAEIASGEVESAQNDSKTNNAKAELLRLRGEVEKLGVILTKAGVKAEEKILATGAEAEIKAEVEKKLSAARKKVAEVKASLAKENTKGEIDARLAAHVKNNHLPAAEEAIAASGAKLLAGILDEALRQAQNAERASSEAAIILEASENMDISTILYPNGINVETSVDAGGGVNGVLGEGEVNVNINSGNEGVEGPRSTGINLDLNLGAEARNE